MGRFGLLVTIGALVGALAASPARSQERIEIDLSERMLYHIEDGDTTRYPVAIGKGYSRGADRRFETPVGEYSVLVKESGAPWVPPAWRYVEFASPRGLTVRELPLDGRVPIDDGRQHLEVDRTGVYRVTERGLRIRERSDVIVYDGAVWVPPLGNPQRIVEGAMGTRRLRLTWDGIFIHGTPNESSLGDAVSHGCVRMANADVEELYSRVRKGTRVIVKP